MYLGHSAKEKLGTGCMHSTWSSCTVYMYVLKSVIVMFFCSHPQWMVSRECSPAFAQVWRGGDHEGVGKLGSQWKDGQTQCTLLLLSQCMCSPWWCWQVWIGKYEVSYASMYTLGWQLFTGIYIFCDSGLEHVMWALKFVIYIQKWYKIDILLLVFYSACTVNREYFMDKIFCAIVFLC